MRAIIIGARGHGRMILSLLRARGHEIVGFVDRDETLHGRLVDGLPVLGATADYSGLAVCLGIGTNTERKRVFHALIEAGHWVLDMIHPSAIVNVGATIGRNVILNTGCVVEHDCRIGDHAHICPSAVLCGGVSVGEGAVVGANATVKDGLTIGAWATVGCGAVVVKDVPPGLTVVGNPAQFVAKREFDDEGFVVMRELFDPEPLQWALQQYVQEEGSFLSGRAVSVTGGQINSLHGIRHELFDKTLESEKMVTLASALLGEQAVPRAVEVFAKPAHVGLKSPWHQDNAYWCLEPAIGLTMWLALDAADAENGGLTYVRRSHRLGLLSHRPSFAPGSSQTLERLPDGERVTPTLNPGDASIHHCLTIHGSAANQSAHPRRGVTFQYCAASTRVNEAKRRLYESSLAEQIRGRA